MADTAPPTVNTDGIPNPLNQGPEDYADLANGLAKIIANALQKTENMLPCRVVSYDRPSNTAIVHPLIQILMTANTYSRQYIGPIPVFAMGGGNFVINYPLKAGDLGWMMANDRDITNFLQTLSESKPYTYRKHDFNDAVLFPDAIRNFNTTGEDGNMVLQTLDGTVKISLGANQIAITHPTQVFLNTPLVTCLKDVHAAGTITGDTDVVWAGISGKGHGHNAQGGTTPLLDGQGHNVTGSTGIGHN